MTCQNLFSENNISMCRLLKTLPRMVSIKVLSKIVADNILLFLFFFTIFMRKIRLGISFEGADDSLEISNLFFSEKKKIKMLLDGYS